MHEKFRAAALCGLLTISSIGCEHVPSNPSSQTKPAVETEQTPITAETEDKTGMAQDIQTIMRSYSEIKELSIYVPEDSEVYPQQINIQFTHNGTNQNLSFPNGTSLNVISTVIKNVLAEQQTEASTSPLPSLSPK